MSDNHTVGKILVCQLQNVPGRALLFTAHMSTITEKWLHTIAADVLRLPPLNPVVTSMLISVVELHIKKIIQEAHKFQRHGKSKLLSG